LGLIPEDQALDVDEPEPGKERAAVRVGLLRDRYDLRGLQNVGVSVEHLTPVRPES
jgi:hypothetical protein